MQKVNIFKNLIVITQFILSVFTYGQEYNYNFVNIRNDDRPNQNHVNSFCMDSLGYLWIGTNFGLQKFDGLSYETFYNDPFDSTSIPSNSIIVMLLDKEGTLIIGTLNGIAIKKKNSNKFESYQKIVDDSTSISGNVITGLCQDNDGLIWITTREGGMSSFNLDTRKFEQFKSLERGIDLGHVVVDNIDPNLLWVSGRSGLSTFNKKTKEENSLDYLLDDLGTNYSNCQIRSFLFEGDSVIWLAATRLGILKYMRYENRFELFEIDPVNSIDQSFVGVTSLLRRDENTIWCATSYGLTIFNTKTGKFSSFNNELSKSSDGPEVAMCIHLYRDYQNNLWSGFRNGITCLNPQKQGIHFNRVKSEKLINSAFYRVSDLYIDSSNRRTFISTIAGQGAFLLDHKTGEYEQLSFNNKIPELDIGMHIYKIMVDKKGNCYMHTCKAIYIWNEAKHTMLPYTKSVELTKLTSRLEPWIICEGAKGNYWFAGKEKGAFFGFDFNMGRIREINDEKVDDLLTLEKSYIEDIREVPDRNELWVLYQKGLVRYNLESKSAITYKVEINNPTGLNGFQPLNVVEDSQGFIWITSLPGGLYRIDPNLSPDQEVLQLNEFLDLTNKKSFECIAHDKYLWWITNKDISCLNTETFSFRTFGYESGYIGNNYFPTIIIDPNNRFYVTAFGGYMKFDPKDLFQIKSIPKVYLEKVKVNGTLYEVDKQIIDFDTLLLEREETNLEFRYTGINFFDHKNNAYHYQLVGWDKDWIDAESRTVASYANLLPGWYTFKVKCKSNHGDWSPTKMLVVFIPKAFYETLVFKILAVACIIGLIGFIVYRRNKRLRKAAEQKVLFKKQLLEMEMVSLRSQMNPHFLFNSLNSINRFVMKKEPREAAKYLADFSALIRKILNNSSFNKIALEEELETLTLYIKLEQLRFENHFDYSIEIGKNIDAGYIKIPPLILQPYVENAIWHGLMTLKRKGKLTIHICADEDELVCTIEDDGIGREKAMALKKEQITSYQSKGMNISKQRIEKMYRLENKKGSISIIDLKDKDDIACGTRVILTIPI